MTQTWLITGVSGGLGREIAAAALARGDVVAGTVRRKADVEAFEALAPGRARGLVMDVTDPVAVVDAVRAAEALTGQIDVLVNNAGYGLVGAVEEASLDEVRAQFETNVFGPLSVLKAVLPAMRARRAGRVVNVTSVSGLAVWAGTGVYCASKWALEGLTQTLAAEVAELGIKVTNVAPGGLRTAFAKGSKTIVADKLADYDGLARDAEKIMADHAGSEPGDPAKAAQAVLAIVDAESPPLHLLLGEDALKYAAYAADGLKADIDAWRELSLSIAFD
ncbi:short-chain dehydrogenase/reductase [Caulobacter flavus]|uniref:Short-chain dehydrogenase/reductase n=1 Tax=Caulobacter flavus TaxID=1679497 RepID=A0A2N5CUX7_9CAUL|nr:oxidoreductase [Caulobacter flavus]AYV45377.1 short-chain dehydrogenase/reductase [Caulobacter flavus]PLR17609.1 short-chain dehydrogenase/reductase [Caulobacter flavus]